MGGENNWICIFEAVRGCMMTKNLTLQTEFARSFFAQS